MNKMIIVTGAAGFIGRNTVAALNAKGVDDIILVDNLGKSEKWRNLTGLSFEDILSVDGFRKVVRKDKLPGIESVIHLGACSATTETDADYLVDNNYRYTRELCQWCMKKNIRFVYASSAATYGAGEQGYSDDDSHLPHLRPLNMYGYSKHMFDLWALKNRLFDRIAGLKYFNVYGPYEDHKDDMRSVIHKAYGQILKSGEVGLFKSYRPDYNDGDQLRDFVYVKDAVDVTLFLAENRAISGLFNCGTGCSRTWNDLARSVFAAIDKTPSIRYIEMPEALQSKYQYFTEADMTKLRSAGYTDEFTSLEDGVKDYVQHYLHEKYN